MRVAELYSERGHSQWGSVVVSTDPFKFGVAAAQVCDFGTSRLLTSHRPLLRETSFTGGTSAQDMASLTATMTMGVGTLLWMAPELFLRGGSKYGPEVDVYVAVGGASSCVD
jgi:serine/threonine protein kinase